MFNIIIFNNKTLIKKLSNHIDLEQIDIDLIKTNLSGYNNALFLIDCLLQDKRTSKIVDYYIYKLIKEEKYGSNN